VPDGAYTVPFGKASVARQGEHITLVAWSAAVELCLRAANRLEEEGVSASVLDLRTLVPLDVDTLCSEVAKTGRCVVVHEAPLSAGFGAEISATLMEQLFYDLDAPVARVAAYDVPFPPASLEDYYLPSLDRVLTAVRTTLES
jgi:pyruvate dehydrogenase E1 component beta subunit